MAVASGGERPRGTLRISAPLLFSQTAMGRIAADFALAYPEVRLEVTTEDRAVDMIEEGVDLVIRVNPAPDESLVGRAFLRDRLVVVAPPDLARPEADTTVPAVVRSTADRALWRFKGPDGTRSVEIEPVLGLASLIMVRDAVKIPPMVTSLPSSTSPRRSTVVVE